MTSMIQAQRDIFCRIVRDFPEAFKDPIDEFFKANPLSERLDKLINSICAVLDRSLPQDDLEKRAEVVVCITYAYQRCMAKSDKPDAGSLVKFLKKMQSGKVLSFQEKENKRAEKGGQLTHLPPPQELASLSDEAVMKILAQDRDLLTPFKAVLRDRSVSSIEKFEMIGEGFDVAERIVKMLFRNQEKVDKRVHELTKSLNEEKGKREALEVRLAEANETLGKAKEDNFAYLGKIDEGKAKRKEQDDKINELERKGQESGKKLEAQEETIKVQRGLIDDNKEEDRKRIKSKADEAWNNQERWTVFSFLTLGALSPLTDARRIKWAMLKAQYKLFDRLSLITDMADRLQQINIYANMLLRKEGFWVRITGTQKFSNGRLWTGEFYESKVLEIDGVLTGPGDYEFSGRFYDGKPHGTGFEKSPNGTYNGEFSHGKYDGFGIMEAANGDYYEGRFLAGQKEGLGILELANGDEYRGEFKKGEFHGVGRYQYYDSADFFEGVFQEGYFLHGKGLQMFANGASYRGEFVDGKFHGEGVLSFADGQVEIGIFEEGVFKG